MVRCVGRRVLALPMFDDWRAGDIRARWLSVLRRLHLRRVGPPQADDRFDFEVVDIGDDGADLVLHAFFKAGERYCCAQAGCLFHLEPGMWPRWRAAMTEECIDHLGPVRILSWRVTVQAGAIFDSGVKEGPGRVTQAAFSYDYGSFEEPEEP